MYSFNYLFSRVKQGCKWEIALLRAIFFLLSQTFFLDSCDLCSMTVQAVVKLIPSYYYFMLWIHDILFPELLSARHAQWSLFLYEWSEKREIPVVEFTKRNTMRKQSSIIECNYNINHRGGPDHRQFCWTLWCEMHQTDSNITARNAMHVVTDYK